MKFAAALPQLGRAASLDSLKQTARLAEDLGFSDIWLNDQIGFAADTDHPAPRIYDPISCLAVAATVTRTIGLGSQFNAAYYPPAFLAKVLASIDSLSGGRLKIAVGVGWQKAEFDAMGSDFATRGRRTDEIIPILRSCWETGVLQGETEHYRFPMLKITPQPAHRIPVWIAGTTTPAFERAIRLGDGYHGQPTRRDCAENTRQNAMSSIPALVRELRASRPDPTTFTISMYTHEWDPADTDAALIRDEWAFLEEAGVQHVVAAFHQRDGDAWARSIEKLARILEL